MRCVVASVLVVALLAVAGAEGYGAKIAPQEEDCFSETIGAGGKISIAFSVTHGGKLDIDASVYAVQLDDESLDDSAHGETSADYARKDRPVARELKTTKEFLKDWTGTSDGNFDYQTESPSKGRKHKHDSKLVICFNNKMAKWTPKWVSFAFYKMEASESTDGLNTDEMNFVHALHGEAMSLHSVMTTTVTMRQEEELHRNFVESTNSWVLWGTLVNCGMLVLMSFFQFWYLKRFLSVKHVIRNM